MSLKVFVTSWCGHCKTEMPRIRAAASKLGYTTRVIDIDRCEAGDKAKCDQVSFVPHIELNGRQVSIIQLESMAQNK